MNGKLKTAMYRIWFKREQLKVHSKLPTEIRGFLIICDIDNTILERLHDGKKSYSTDFRIYEKVVDFLKQEYTKSGATLFFLSARSITYYASTKKLLLTIFEDIPFDLIFTRTAADKIYYLEFYARYANVIFIDDLSFKNSSNELQLYDDVISRVLKIKSLRHIGYNELVKMQKG